MLMPLPPSALGAEGRFKREIDQKSTVRCVISFRLLSFILPFMIVNPRQQRLVAEVKRRGSVSVEELAQMLDVTAQTIRRDVATLAEAGLVARFHGGVGIPASTVENIAYRQRQALNPEGKARIARAVAARIPSGCSLFMNIGTTIEAVARELLRHDDLRVVTN